MAQSQHHGTPQGNRRLPVLEQFKNKASGIYELCIQKKIKVLIGFLPLILLFQKADRFLTAKDQFCSHWTGKTQRNLSAALKFLCMAGILPAGPAQAVLSLFNIKIAEIFLI